MKKFFLIPLLLIFGFSCSKKDEITPEENRIYKYDEVDVVPEYTEGEVEMRWFLGKNINYPPEAYSAGVQGRVTVQFIVEKDGAIGDVKILRGIGYGCDDEVVRVIKLMPNWEPGKIDGKNVRVAIVLPIVFALKLSLEESVGINNVTRIPNCNNLKE